MLVLVLAVLTVSYASSLKAYLQQRQHIAEIKAQIAQSEADIDALEREKARWRDPAYIQSQARARFGYVMPGETSYVVLGADGKPLEAETALTPKQDVLVKEPTAWYRDRLGVRAARRQPARAGGEAEAARPHRRPEGLRLGSCPLPLNDLMLLSH